MYTARNKTVVVFINEIVVVIQCNVLLKVRIKSPSFLENIIPPYQSEYM